MDHLWFSDPSIASGFQHTIFRTVLFCCSGALCTFLAFVLYQWYFHPLCRFPGPKLAAISNFPYSRSYLGGRQPWDILKLHDRYGPVVRISPNDLSFNTAKSWSDIYGVRKGQASCFIKSNFYDGGNFADQAHSIVSERDPEKHHQMRKFLSRAFSDTSLKEQEALVNTKIDRFVERIGEQGTVDFTHWFNLLTFDIIGELAFGRDFQGIETGQTHFWINDVLGSMSQASVSDTLTRFPVLGKAWLVCNPGWISKLMVAATRHQKYTIELTTRRLQEDTGRKDFMSYLLQDRDDSSDIQLAAHASDFVIAGSETTATTLAVLFYYMCTTPSAKQELEREVLSAFSAYGDINATSAASLKYLHAVCQEALRMFPPLPLGLPREVPKGGETVDGFYVPEGTIVSTNPYAASMSSSNFESPEQFRPSRWLSGELKDNLDASRPFSFGPRACLGRGLAWLELHVTVAKIIYTYELELVDGSLDWNKEARMSLLWKKPDLNIKLTKRTR
ncbi:Isotrichodermin C-15 hydroxylase 7 [Colletotrichum chlorophyti]|uniref:Isotrichodermin C-15 hydroxylase 7 n=1 Tax=Colletotrichum chlorophyti TaxID=708187 RepID=A0A1Q8S704_9PEZI|nr:Isotrichodermin C-15 hydroxylase 7 [Colletotrichum chlorophyti]